MTGQDSNSAYWAAARAPRWPHSRYMNAAYNRPQPSETVLPAPTEDTAETEAVVSQHAGEFVGLRSPEPHPALTVEQRVALNMANVHDTTGTAGRELDYAQAEAARHAARGTTLAVPNYTESR